MALSGREKATILLSLLGTELSERILDGLPPDMGDSITSLITSLPNPSAEVVAEVLKEFSDLMLPSPPVVKAIEEAVEIKRQEAPVAPVSEKSPFDILFYSQPKKIAAALSAERGAVCAFCLSLLPPVQAGEVMLHMPEKRKEIEDILRGMKKPPIAEKIVEKILPILSDRIERMAYSR